MQLVPGSPRWGAGPTPLDALVNALCVELGVADLPMPDWSVEQQVCACVWSACVFVDNADLHHPYCSCKSFTRRICCVRWTNWNSAWQMMSLRCVYVHARHAARSLDGLHLHPVSPRLP